MSPALKTPPKKKTWKSYDEYLKSPAWRTIRSAVMTRDKHECRICGKEADHAHHHKYPKDWNDDSLDNCIAVCSACHERTHGLSKRVELEPHRTWQRAIGVQWREGYDVVITDGDGSEVIVSRSQVRWLIGALETVKKRYCWDSSDDISDAIEAVGENLNGIAIQIHDSFDALVGACKNLAANSKPSEPEE